MNNKSETIKRFEEALSADESLRNKFEAAIKKITDEGTAQSDGEVMVKAAKELGFEISIDEMERFFAEMQEIDDNELENVAGGRKIKFDEGSKRTDEYGRNLYCLGLWHCYTGFLHTDTESKEASCWKNYSCILANKYLHQGMHQCITD